MAPNPANIASSQICLDELDILSDRRPASGCFEQPPLPGRWIASHEPIYYMETFGDYSIGETLFAQHLRDSLAEKACRYQQQRRLSRDHMYHARARASQHAVCSLHHSVVLFDHWFDQMPTYLAWTILPHNSQYCSAVLYFLFSFFRILVKHSMRFQIHQSFPCCVEHFCVTRRWACYIALTNLLLHWHQFLSFTTCRPGSHHGNINFMAITCVTCAHLLATLFSSERLDSKYNMWNMHYRVLNA